MVFIETQDLDRFGVTEAQIAEARCDERWRQLMRFQVDRARALMLAGAPLGSDLPGRIGLEIRAIVAGGLRILDKIEAVDYDIFRRRPVLARQRVRLPAGRRTLAEILKARGYATGGFGNVFGPTLNNNSKRELYSGSFTAYAGNHEIKLGGDYQQEVDLASLFKDVAHNYVTTVSAPARRSFSLV